MSTSDAYSDIEDTKTLKHIVLFSFREGTSEETIKKALENATNLQSSIPQVLSVQAGPNLAEGLDGGFTHGFIVELTDKQSKEEFMEHNDQAAVMRELIPNLKNIIKFDLY
ncbi:hypothetical protein AKO1_002975 [Acrasis kona]|uniref:Stress-response A/B barrel domain-containing protein n=1 Tax=Acrasis kona TaxID=1008807 RepID=A0AAW2Z964_9EUKA